MQGGDIEGNGDTPAGAATVSLEANNLWATLSFSSDSGYVGWVFFLI